MCICRFFRQQPYTVGTSLLWFSTGLCVCLFCSGESHSTSNEWTGKEETVGSSMQVSDGVMMVTVYIFHCSLCQRKGHGCRVYITANYYYIIIVVLFIVKGYEMFSWVKIQHDQWASVLPCPHLNKVHSFAQPPHTASELPCPLTLPPIRIMWITAIELFICLLIGAVLNCNIGVIISTLDLLLLELTINYL